MRTAFAAVLVAALSLTGAAVAQTTTTPAVTPQPTAAAPALAVDADKAMVPVWPKAATRLPDTAEPSAVAFTMGDVEGVDPKLLTGVTAEGYAHKVAVDNKRIGQVLVTAVSKGAKTEPISTEGLAAQFDAGSEGDLFPEKSLTVEGSRKALVAALERLQTTDDKKETKDAKNDVQDNAVGQGSKGSNDQASAYKTPDAPTLKAEEKAEPVVDTTTTADGCKVRVDLARGVAIQQSKTRTTSDGAVSEEGACTDSEVSWPLKQSYLSCQDVVDTTALKVWPQFTTYYEDDMGETHTVSQCQKDEQNPITIVEDKSSCPVSVNMEVGKAVPRAALVYTNRAGSAVRVRECADLDGGFPLKRSYLSCPDLVDTPALKAWPQYTTYYVDEKGETHTVGQCSKDEEKPFAISENEKSCPVFLDFAKKLAVPQSVLVYTNSSKVTVQARDCDTSTISAAIPMTETKAECPLRHDFAAGKSYELSMWSYRRDGLLYQAAPCADTGRTFNHETVYMDTAGEYVCTPIVDMKTSKVTLQSRKRITVDGASQFITECAPDTNSLSVMSTTDGCMDPSKWTHDIPAGVSYGQERFYYLKGGTERVYVTQCQNSTVTYAHGDTVTGYQYHDDQLFAYPLTTVAIKINGSPYNIKTSEVLPGAAQNIYIQTNSIDRASGNQTYQGCDAYQPTTRYYRWTRPDGTIYERAGGAGTPQGPMNVCVSSMETGSYYTVVNSGIYGSTISYRTGIARTTRTNPYTGERFVGGRQDTGISEYEDWAASCTAEHLGKGPFTEASKNGWCQPTISPTQTYAPGDSPCAGTLVHAVSNSGLNGFQLTCGWTPSTAIGW